MSRNIKQSNGRHRTPKKKKVLSLLQRFLLCAPLFFCTVRLFFLVFFSCSGSVGGTCIRNYFFLLKKMGCCCFLYTHTAVRARTRTSWALLALSVSMMGVVFAVADVDVTAFISGSQLTPHLREAARTVPTGPTACIGVHFPNAFKFYLKVYEFVSSSFLGTFSAPDYTFYSVE